MPSQTTIPYMVWWNVFLLLTLFNTRLICHLRLQYHIYVVVWTVFLPLTLFNTRFLFWMMTLVKLQYHIMHFLLKLLLQKSCCYPELEPGAGAEAGAGSRSPYKPCVK